ncbi:transglycosylase SLT domain-containing protein [Lacibacterium aquatile]|uniref:Transglycosylase SLT domain-containing protein n=1 Tax=Lacibacterium aquatile TaxID=1168082 RepID=A0ABW5DUI1_9PROT
MTLTQAPLSRQTPRASDAKVAGYEIDGEVLSSIRHASRKTGVEFGYLMAQAAQESSFQTDAKAGTSSATGLYQFIDSTWLRTMKDHGAKHGLATEANAIQSDGRGSLKVADPAMKQRIMDMRKDPKVAAVLGAEFALSNKNQIEASLGHDVGSTELYLAHFLGAGGATRFLQAIEKNGSQSAASLMPEAAASNKNVFYDKATGRARTVGEVYKLFSRSIETKSDAFASLEDGVAAGPRATGAAKGPAFGPTMANARLLAANGTGPTGLNASGGALASDGLPTGPLNLDLLTMLAFSALESLDATAGEEDQAQVNNVDQRQRAYEAKMDLNKSRLSIQS